MKENSLLIHGPFFLTIVAPGNFERIHYANPQVDASTNELDSSCLQVLQDAFLPASGGGRTTERRHVGNMGEVVHVYP